MSDFLPLHERCLRAANLGKAFLYKGKEVGRGYPYALDGWFILALSLCRYQFQSTNSPELIFSAVLGDDGTRNVRFKRAYST